jgi:hypothetical protein
MNTREYRLFRALGLMGATLMLANSPAASDVERCAHEAQATAAGAGTIRRIEPPEEGFYAKVLYFDGIPIKAPAVVDDRAIFVAQYRLGRMPKNMPKGAV